MKLVPHGEPYAGKLHVRFDEGAGVPDEGRPALLYPLMVGFGWWGCAKKGLSVDDEKQQKVRRRDFARFEQSLPDRVPHLLEKGSDKVAYDILKQLADGPRRPAELRAALGIASANFFTARYLTPLAKSGYIAVAGGEKNRYLPGKQYRILRKGKAVVRA